MTQLRVATLNADIGALADAFNLVDFGIVLLDGDLNVHLINQAFATICGLRSVLIEAGSTLRIFIERAIRNDAHNPLLTGMLEFVQDREQEIRSGADRPRRVKLKDGRCVLFRCSVRPCGGRILSFIDISQEVQREVAEVIERFAAEARFSTETMEGQAAYLATLAEAAQESAQRAEVSCGLLRKEVAERRLLEMKLRVLATIDGLTGALNRSETMAAAERAFDDARLTGRHLTLVMVDVDHFKAINDQFGHAGGDHALRHLVDVLRGGIRELDFIGRLGGEEFLIAFPGMPPDGAATIVERLRNTVSGSLLPFGDKLIGLTISMGAACLQPADVSVEQIVLRADGALYRAKSTGRNRVEWSPRGLSARLPGQLRPRFRPPVSP